MLYKVLSQIGSTFLFLVTCNLGKLLVLDGPRVHFYL
ncbi:MAG: hypothetical protein ACI8VL_001413, partial [Bacteroidia bacterium]